MNILVGPVLLDFPYVFKLDGNKLYCTTRITENNNSPCGGSIDYDDGFNNLKCSKCGRLYLATELKKEDSLIILNNEEDIQMKVQFCKGKSIVKEVEQSTDYINIEDAKPSKPRSFRNETILDYGKDDALGTIIIASRPKYNNGKKTPVTGNPNSGKKFTKPVSDKPKEAYVNEDKEVVTKELVIDINNEAPKKSVPIEEDDIVLNVQLGSGDNFDRALKTSIKDLTVTKDEESIPVPEESTDDPDIIESEKDETQEIQEEPKTDNDDEDASSDYLEEPADKEDIQEEEEEDYVPEGLEKATFTTTEELKINRKNALSKYGLSDEDFREFDESPTFEKINKKKESAY